MARSNNNILLHGITGQIGKQIVIKRYGNRTVVTAYPDMSNIKPSKMQKQKRKTFAEAVAYAKAITSDPEKKALYQARVKKGRSVYNYAMAEYLKKK